jgi:two-component system, NarL family, sensor kinase
MSRRAAAWLAWLLAGVSLALGLAGAVLGILNGYSPIELVREVAVGVILAVTFPLVGAVVASRRPGNPLGWIFCAIGLAEGLVTTGWEYGTFALRTRPGSVPGGEAASWFGVWSWALGLGLLVTFALLLFPDGRLPSPRWRPLAWLSALPIAIFCGPVAVAAWPHRGPALLDPAGAAPSLPAAVAALAGVAFPLMLLCGVAAVPSSATGCTRSTGSPTAPWSTGS